MALQSWSTSSYGYTYPHFLFPYHQGSWSVLSVQIHSDSWWSESLPQSYKAFWYSKPLHLFCQPQYTVQQSSSTQRQLRLLQFHSDFPEYSSLPVPRLPLCRALIRRTESQAFQAGTYCSLPLTGYRYLEFSGSSGSLDGFSDNHAPRSAACPDAAGPELQLHRKHVKSELQVLPLQHPYEIPRSALHFLQCSSH